MQCRKLKELDQEIIDKLLIKVEWQQRYTLTFLCNDDDIIQKVVWELLQLRRNHPQEYNRLLVSVKTQLGQKEVLQNSRRLRRGKGYRQIYEFKSCSVPGIRLFFYFYLDMIVCTHAWWKAKTSDQEQNNEFKKADKLRNQMGGNNE